MTHPYVLQLTLLPLCLLQLSSIAIPYNSLTGPLPISWGTLKQASTPSHAFQATTSNLVTRQLCVRLDNGRQ